MTTYGEKMFDNVTITVELFDRSNAPDGNTLTDNRWVEYVNQEMNKVGINVEFVGVPRADEVTKMQTMMSSGTAPDIVTTYTYALSLIHIYADERPSCTFYWYFRSFCGLRQQRV